MCPTQPSINLRRTEPASSPPSTKPDPKLTDEKLDASFSDPSYADVFPSIRHALTQVLLGHTAFHLGQLSTWRRAMNLPPLLRSYE